MDHYREEGKVWRLDMKERLKALNIMFIDPYEKPVLHAGWSAFEDDKAFEQRKKLISEGQFQAARDSMKEVTAFDLRCVDRCDFLICHVDMRVRMCGTWDEIYRAADSHKPVLIMSATGVSDLPPWLFGRFPVEFFFESWDALWGYIQHIDGAEEIDTLKNRWKFFDWSKLFEEVGLKTA